MLTKARHLTLSWASWIQFAPSMPRVQLNVIFPPTTMSSQWSLSFGPPKQNSVNTSPHPSACHMSRPPHPSWFNHRNNFWWRIQAVKFIIMQFSPWSIFLPLRSKYPPQHCVFKNPQSVFLPQSERPGFALIQHNWKNYSLVYFNRRLMDPRNWNKSLGWRGTVEALCSVRSERGINK
jgi:hypothetical protein